MVNLLNEFSKEYKILGISGIMIVYTIRSFSLQVTPTRSFLKMFIILEDAYHYFLLRKTTILSIQKHQ